MCINELRGKHGKVGHDNFERNCKENRRGRDLPTLTHWLDPLGRPGPQPKKTPREKTSRGALGAGLRADLPVAFRPRNHRFLDLDIRAGRIHELLETDGGGPVCVTLPTLEQRKGLLKHRERPIGGFDRLREGL